MHPHLRYSVEAQGYRVAKERVCRIRGMSRIKDTDLKGDGTDAVRGRNKKVERVIWIAAVDGATRWKHKRSINRSKIGMPRITDFAAHRCNRMRPEEAQWTDIDPQDQRFSGDQGNAVVGTVPAALPVETKKLRRLSVLDAGDRNV
jgi:hypothetical protein